MTWATIEWVIGWPRRIVCNRLAYWFHRYILCDDCKWFASVDDLAFVGSDTLSPAAKADTTRWREVEPGVWKNMTINQQWNP